MTVRVLYVDVDGTLVGPFGNLLQTGDHEPTLEAAEAIVAARKGGLELVPLSGRNVPSMVTLAMLIGAETWIGELGAVRSYDRGQDVVVDTGAYEGDPAHLMDDLRRAGAALMERFGGQVEEHAPWNAYRETSYMVRGSMDLEEAHEWLAEHGFAWAECIDNGVIPRRFEGLPGVDTVRVYHLNPAGISKRAGIAADRARRGLGREECAVIGDAAADLACHTEVARTFVVANALDKDPGLAALVGTTDAEVTRRGYGEGFADVVRSLLGDGGEV